MMVLLVLVVTMMMLVLLMVTMMVLVVLVVTMMVLVVVDQNAGGTVRNTSATVMTVCTWASACFCPMIDHSHPALLCLTTLHCDSIPTQRSATKLVTAAAEFFFCSD